MNKKVTLLELVGTKIIYAVLIAVYYWMVARRDWHDIYISIQNAVICFTVIFLLSQASRIKKFKQEVMDELAQQNLTRANSICLKIALVMTIAITFAGALEFLNGIAMGYALVAMLVVISIIRTIIFYLMDTKGI